MKIEEIRSTKTFWYILLCVFIWLGFQWHFQRLQRQEEEWLQAYDHWVGERIAMVDSAYYAKLHKITPDFYHANAETIVMRTFSIPINCDSFYVGESTFDGWEKVGK